LGTVC